MKHENLALKLINDAKKHSVNSKDYYLLDRYFNSCHDLNSSSDLPQLPSSSPSRELEKLVSFTCAKMFPVTGEWLHFKPDFESQNANEASKSLMASTALQKEMGSILRRSNFYDSIRVFIKNCILYYKAAILPSYGSSLYFAVPRYEDICESGVESGSEKRMYVKSRMDLATLKAQYVGLSLDDETDETVEILSCVVPNNPTWTPYKTKRKGFTQILVLFKTSGEHKILLPQKRVNYKSFPAAMIDNSSEDSMAELALIEAIRVNTLHLFYDERVYYSNEPDRAIDEAILSSGVDLHQGGGGLIPTRTGQVVPQPLEMAKIDEKSLIELALHVEGNIKRMFHTDLLDELMLVSASQGESARIVLDVLTVILGFLQSSVSNIADNCVNYTHHLLLQKDSKYKEKFGQFEGSFSDSGLFIMLDRLQYRTTISQYGQAVAPFAQMKPEILEGSDFLKLGQVLLDAFKLSDFKKSAKQMQESMQKQSQMVQQSDEQQQQLNDSQVQLNNAKAQQAVEPS